MGKTTEQALTYQLTAAELIELQAAAIIKATLEGSYRKLSDSRGVAEYKFVLESVELPPDPKRGISQPIPLPNWAIWQNWEKIPASEIAINREYDKSFVEMLTNDEEDQAAERISVSFPIGKKGRLKGKQVQFKNRGQTIILRHPTAAKVAEYCYRWITEHARYISASPKAQAELREKPDLLRHYVEMYGPLDVIHQEVMDDPILAVRGMVAGNVLFQLIKFVPDSIPPEALKGSVISIRSNPLHAAITGTQGTSTLMGGVDPLVSLEEQCLASIRSFTNYLDFGSRLVDLEDTKDDFLPPQNGSQGGSGEPTEVGASSSNDGEYQPTVEDLSRFAFLRGLPGLYRYIRKPDGHFGESHGYRAYLYHAPNGQHLVILESGSPENATYVLDGDHGGENAWRQLAKKMKGHVRGFYPNGGCLGWVEHDDRHRRRVREFFD